MIDLEQFRHTHAEQAVLIDGHCWRFYDTEREACPTLFMIPGAFGAAEIFWNQIVALGDSARVVSITLPPIDSIIGLADGIIALMDTLEVPGANLLGSSLGGYLTQVIAARHPQRLQTLFIANSLLGAKDLTRRRDPASLRALTGIEIRRHTLETINSWPDTQPADLILKQLLAEHGARCLSDKMIKSRSIILHSLPEAPHVDIPLSRVVIIECDDDPMISESGRARVCERFAGARTHTLNRGGHFPYITRPDIYTAIIARRLLS